MREQHMLFVICGTLVAKADSNLMNHRQAFVFQNCGALKATADTDWIAEDSCEIVCSRIAEYIVAKTGLWYFCQYNVKSSSAWYQQDLWMKGRNGMHRRTNI